MIKLAADLQKGGLSESTANGVLIVLRAILRHARHIDAMTLDPFAGIDPSELPSPSTPSDQRVLRKDEVWKLIEKTTPSYRAVVTTLAWSGARVSEILGLRWEDIDFVDGAFKIEEQLPPLKRGEAPHRVKTKSEKGKRTVPFLPVVSEALADHLEAELATGRGAATDFVFVTRFGRP